MTEQFLFQAQVDRLRECMPVRVSGSVSRIVGMVVECRGLRAPIGSLVNLHCRLTGRVLDCEVVGFQDDKALLMPFGETSGISRGDTVVLEQRRREVPVSMAMLGRVVDSHGRPIDDKGPIANAGRAPLHAAAPHPLRRARIEQPLQTGVRAIDGLLSVGRGQRMGLFAGSGVGKSVLLGMIARNTSAEVNVIALVGERGREVREFVEDALGPEGLARSVVVVATSDEPALNRVKCTFTASAIAEYFRGQGKHVLLLADSITRIAFAQREIGLSVGEPAATKGYPPSVFALLPRLLERSGCDENGSITGIYTVLVESDDVNEPIADAVRGILDGHIWMSRNLAARGHYPAIDPGLSISRVMPDIVDEEHLKAARQFVSLLTAYREAEDLIQIGAYAKGSSPTIDRAIGKIVKMNEFLTQGRGERDEFANTRRKMLELLDLAPQPAIKRDPAQAQQPQAGPSMRV